MTDEEFAAELAARLQKLVQDDAAALQCVELLIEHRLELDQELGEELAPHPTLMVDLEVSDRVHIRVGLLGIFNGLTGEKVVVAAYDDQTMRLHHFFVKDRHEADD